MNAEMRPRDFRRTESVGEARIESISAFERFARWASFAMGRPSAFLAALVIVLLWAMSGPLFHFSDTWQLAINTGTTIVTFLMVFLIQQSQNRDTLAVQVKLAELIISAKGAHNVLATAETLSEQELRELHDDYAKKAEDTLARLEARRSTSTVRDAIKMEAEAVNEDREAGLRRSS